MAVTETLLIEAVLYCPSCEVDLARVTAREDFRDDLNGTVGAVIIRHMKDKRHLAEARSVREMTWTQMNAARAPEPERQGGE